MRRLVMQSTTKSCSMDPIPTWLLKEMTDCLLPYITSMINASLRLGHFPASQKDTRHRHSTPEEAWFECGRAQELPSSQQSVVHLQGHGEVCSETDCELLGVARSDTSTSVSLPEKSLHGDSTAEGTDRRLSLYRRTADLGSGAVGPECRVRLCRS